MADKFEFKKLQHIDLICEPRLDIKKKPSLLEYKQVILQLSNALNSMSQQNQTLIQQIKTTDQLKQQLKTKLQKQIQKCKQLQNYKISNQEQSRKNNIEIEQYHQKLIQNQQKIKVLESKNQQLQTHVMELLQNKDKLQRINEVNLEKIRVLQQNLDMLIEQGRNIKLQINQANRQKEWQLKEMKQFHDQIKRKFQVLQIQTAENQSYSKDLRFEHKLNDLKQKRSFSTQKKVRRNVGHLSNSNNIQKKTMRSKNYRLDNPICSSVKPFQASLNNPQITEQLKNLKKQIAQQYTLINLKTQTYSKQRVSKTLQELKRKMGKVIQIVQHSQSQSAIEY